MYQIDDDIPPPSDRKPVIDQYPIRLLKVGQSFFVSGRHLSRVRQLLIDEKNRRDIGHVPGWNYTTQKEGDGIRVWRVS